MPNTNVFRPADAVEMASTMLLAFKNEKDPMVVVSSHETSEIINKLLNSILENLII